MSLPTITVTPATAAQAYSRAGDVTGLGGADPADFGGALARALDDAVSINKDAETKSMQAIAGKGSITDVVTAVSKADLALQTTVAIRDRVVQAYQDIMRMPI